MVQDASDGAEQSSDLNTFEINRNTDYTPGLFSQHPDLTDGLEDKSSQPQSSENASQMSGGY